MRVAAVALLSAVIGSLLLILALGSDHGTREIEAKRKSGVLLVRVCEPPRIPTGSGCAIQVT